MLKKLSARQLVFLVVAAAIITALSATSAFAIDPAPGTTYVSPSTGSQFTVSKVDQNTGKAIMTNVTLKFPALDKTLTYPSTAEFPGGFFKNQPTGWTFSGNMDGGSNPYGTYGFNCSFYNSSSSAGCGVNSLPYALYSVGDFIPAPSTGKS